MPTIVILLLIQPLFAIGLVILVRRSSRLRPLVPALVLSGVATALTTACLAFTGGTVPIAPYELGPGAWWPVVGQVLLAFYVGFGLGVIIAALIGLPYQRLVHRRRSP